MPRRLIGFEHKDQPVISRTAFARQHVTARVDQRVLDGALKSADGVPIRVSADGVVARRPAE